MEFKECCIEGHVYVPHAVCNGQVLPGAAGIDMIDSSPGAGARVGGHAPCTCVPGCPCCTAPVPEHKADRRRPMSLGPSRLPLGVWDVTLSCHESTVTVTVTAVREATGRGKAGHVVGREPSVHTTCLLTRVHRGSSTYTRSTCTHAHSRAPLTDS